jgi:hypothetical protein
VPARGKPGVCSTLFLRGEKIKITKRMEIWQISTPEINSILKNGVKRLKYKFVSKLSLFFPQKTGFPL